MDDFDFTIPHEITKETYGSLYGIRFTSGKYADIIITYGKTGLKEKDDGTLILKYDYNIEDLAGKTIDDKEEFEQVVGDLLREFIIDGLKHNSIVYTGGVDENRDDNFIQFDYE